MWLNEVAVTYRFLHYSQKMLFTSKVIILKKTDNYEQMPIRVKF
jgi:hypothetical protein